MVGRAKSGVHLAVVAFRTKVIFTLQLMLPVLGGVEVTKAVGRTLLVNFFDVFFGNVKTNMMRIEVEVTAEGMFLFGTVFQFAEGLHVDKNFKANSFFL